MLNDRTNKKGVITVSGGWASEKMKIEGKWKSIDVSVLMSKIESTNLALGVFKFGNFNLC